MVGLSKSLPGWRVVVVSLVAMACADAPPANAPSSGGDGQTQSLIQISTTFFFSG
jgi:hypothetical protein